MLANAPPSKIQLPFANAGSKNTIPVASQIGVTPGAASFTDGFPPLTMTPLASGGVPPAGADFNGVLNAITAIQQWQSAGGGFKYDAAYSTAVSGYPKGAVLCNAANDGYWMNLSDGNTTDPDGGSAANWVPVDQYGIAAITGLTNANVTLSQAQSGKPVITLAGTLTGNVQIIFPATVQQWMIVNNTTGNFTVTCKPASGTGVVAPQGAQASIWGDGVNLYAFVNVASSVQDFRITVSTGVPVTTADVTAATTVCLTPYRGNRFGFADGSVVISPEVSIAVPAVANQVYDLFTYNNAGALALEVAAWTNDTTRATALAMSNGTLVKSGATTRRYVGSFRTIASGQTEDSVANRYVWNYYNRVVRLMRRTEPASSWTYSTAGTIRQANGNSANQINFLVGVSEDAITAGLLVTAGNSVAASNSAIYLGYDSVTGGVLGSTGYSMNAPAANVPYGLSGSLVVTPAAGRHYIAWLESVNNNVASFYSSNGAGILATMTA